MLDNRDAKLRQLLSMKINQSCVVSLTWILKDTLNDELDVLTEPVDFLIGGSDLFKKIEDALQGHVQGDTVQIHLEPEEAFGDFDETLVYLESRELFPPELEEGMTIEGSALPSGCNPDAPKNIFYTVTELYPEHVVLDGNHPLSGIALRLTLTVQNVRQATDIEISQASAGTGFFKIQPLHSQLPGSISIH
jgi:FKBP-type peptidyl-prolyl cis-trans isomerase SlyD